MSTEQQYKKEIMQAALKLGMPMSQKQIDEFLQKNINWFNLYTESNRSWVLEKKIKAQVFGIIE